MYCLMALKTIFKAYYMFRCLGTKIVKYVKYICNVGQNMAFNLK